MHTFQQITIMQLHQSTVRGTFTACPKSSSTPTPAQPNLGAKSAALTFIAVILLFILLLPLCLQLQHTPSRFLHTAGIVVTDADRPDASKIMSHSRHSSNNKAKGNCEETTTRVRTEWNGGKERVVTVTTADDLEE